MSNKITWRLEHENVGRLLVHYAIPTVIGTMVNALYNIVDRIFIGQGVGALAISGLTLTFPVFLLLQACGMLIGTGTAARISICLGHKDKDWAEHVLGNAFTLTFIMYLITVIPSMLFLDELLYAFGGSEQTIPYAKDYLNIAIPGSLFATLSFSFNAVMRASGYPHKAMITMMMGAVLNVVLDPLFIFVFDMGIRGAAIATVISMAICTAFVMSHFFHKESIIHFHQKYFRLKASIIKNILAIGMSPFFMQLAGSVVVVIMNNALKANGGDLAIGASGIISSVAMLLVLFVVGLAQGMQPIIGFNYGAGKMERVYGTLKLGIIIATVVTSLGALASLFFPRTIVGLFSSDPALMAMTENGLGITMLVFYVVGSQIIISQFFQSIGCVGKAIFMSLSRQFLFLIPATLVFPLFWGIDGVWMAQPFSDFIAAVTGWIFLWHFVKHGKFNSKQLSA